MIDNKKYSLLFGYFVSFSKWILPYLIIFLLCSSFLIYEYNLLHRDINIPLVGFASGDYLAGEAVSKAIMESGYFVEARNLGMPFVSSFWIYMNGVDYILSIKCINLLFNNPILCINMVFFLSFYMVAFFSYLTMRFIKINPIISILFSLLFSFLPYHFIRIGHLFLCNYYIVPLVVLLCLWISKGELYPNSTSKLNRLVVVGFFIAILTGLTNGYYGFFSVFLLIIAGIVSFGNNCEKKNYLCALLFVITIISVQLFFIAYYINTTNPTSSELSYISDTRTSSNHELFGLRMVQLFLPLYHHIPLLSGLGEIFTNSGVPINENKFVSLGIIGSIGFIFSILFLLIQENNLVKAVIGDLSIHQVVITKLQIFMFFFCTIGGFASIIMMVFPVFRAFNRGSVFISFLSLVSLAILLNGIYIKIHSKKLYGVLLLLILIFACFLGVWEQSPSPIIQNADDVKIFDQYESYFSYLENVTPNTTTMIYQYPFVSIGQSRFGYTDGYLPYILSKKLRWSYTMYPNLQESWHNQFQELSIPNQMSVLNKLGFGGILFDTKVLPNTTETQNLEKYLAMNSSMDPIKSLDSRYQYYLLTSMNKSDPYPDHLVDCLELSESGAYIINKEKLVKNTTFYPNKFKTFNGSFNTDYTLISQNKTMAGSGNYLIYGLLSPLYIGNYNVTCSFYVENVTNILDPVGFIEVENSNRVIASDYLYSDGLKNLKLNKTISFKIKKDVIPAEFKIYQYPNADLYVSFITIN